MFQNLNVIAFMNMNELKNLKISSISRVQIKELCDQLPALDRISADGIEFSCYVERSRKPASKTPSMSQKSPNHTNGLSLLPITCKLHLHASFGQRLNHIETKHLRYCLFATVFIALSVITSGLAYRVGCCGARTLCTKRNTSSTRTSEQIQPNAMQIKRIGHDNMEMHV